MKFEGKQVSIPVKGIMRVGTDNLSADGAMNEVIGMEYKDGSWLPYKDKEAEDDHAAFYIEGHTYVAKKIYVHKTSEYGMIDLYLLDLDTPTLYYYVYSGESDDEGTKTKIVDGVRDVSFVGNMLCVATDNGVKYFLYKNGEYEEQKTSNRPNVELRVTSGLYNADNPNRVGMRHVSRMSARSDGPEHPIEEDARREAILGGLNAARGAVREQGGLTGYVLACVAYRHKSGGISFPSAPVLLGRPIQVKGDETNGYKETNIIDSNGKFDTLPIQDAQSQSDSDMKNFIKAGPSPLPSGNSNDYAICELPPPPEYLWEEYGERIAEGEGYIEQHTDSTYGAYLTTLDGIVKVPYPSGEGPSTPLYYHMLVGIDKDQDFVDIFGTGMLSSKPASEEIVYTGDPESPETAPTHVMSALMTATGYPYTVLAKNRAAVPTLACSMMHLNLHRDASNLQGAWFHKYIFEAYAAANKLQYKISNADSIEDGDIESVCIFMSDEISPFYLEKTNFSDVVYNDENPVRIFHIENKPLWDESCMCDYDGYLQYYQAKYKSEAEIIREIGDIKSLYLVKEIAREEIADSTDWETVDLKGMLGENLLTRETLPSTAFDDLAFITPNHLNAYNYRLHEYDYLREYFKGYDYPLFAYNGGEGQHEAWEPFGSGEYKWEIKVNIKDDDGNTTVVTYDDSEEVYSLLRSLTPYISYPSIYADSITIRVYKVAGTGGSGVGEKTFALRHNRSLGISYYVDPELKPILMTMAPSQNIPEHLPSEDFQAEFTTRSYANGLKVSDIALPSYFPTRFTYRIGNDRIIGLGRLTVPVSQDNRGANKLVIFCTDGIYTLDVDTSGTGAYSNLFFADGEVCVNRNTICEIGGAIVFASEKGLMMINSKNGVEEFIPSLNGKIRFLPKYTGDDIKDGKHIYGKILTDSGLTQLADNISREDFLKYLKKEGTFVSYIAEKNKLLVFNNSDETENDYCYFIDIPTRNTTKFAVKFITEDGNNIHKRFWTAKRIDGHGSAIVRYDVRSHVFEQYSQEANIDCLIASRPIKVQQDDKSSYRVVITGYFEGAADKWAGLVVLGSLDADNWRVIGRQNKKLEGGFHNIGCTTDRVSWKYLMFIFGGQLSSESHIDYIDITVEGRYNNKKR